MRHEIITEIKRITHENGGNAPGQETFTNATGISAGKWRGVYWARWSDALVEAGLVPNMKKGRLESTVIIDQIIEFSKIMGRLPTQAEMKLRRRGDEGFPSPSTIYSHFKGRSELVAALTRRAIASGDAALLLLLPEAPVEPELDSESGQLGVV